MNEPLPDSELVVSTPERVSFEYQVAGLGTRAIAQILDLLILAFVLGGLTFAAIAFGAMGQDVLGYLVAVIGGFIVIFGYFWACEAFWSGQTVGKKAFRLRAVGDRGEPMTLFQAGIRNLVRYVDFLPYGYGLGLVVLFINGKGKRLGDHAAGQDSDAVWLWQLPGGRPASSPPPAIPAPAAAAPAPVTFAAATPEEVILRRLDPELRRFVSSYARRRPELPVFLRSQLAGMLQHNLQAAAPDVFTQNGPLGALDYLADLDIRRATPAPAAP
jgi:uncharacterized RDD family membrane protein YckC